MKEFPTSNNNYKIKQPTTQADYFFIEQEVIPDTVEEIIVYSPVRNRHVYSTMSYSNSNNN